MSAVIHKPALSPIDIPPLVRKLYGLEVTVRKELVSYDDQNFHVDIIPASPQPSQLASVCSTGYVFKVINSLDSAKPEVLAIQTEIIIHVKRTGYPIPSPIPTLRNTYQELLSLSDPNSNDNGTDRYYMVRLFSFIPGKTLDQVVLTNDLCFQVGWFAGKLDVILKDFSTQNSLGLSSLSKIWNMTEVPRLKDKLQYLTSTEQRTVAKEIIEQFETKVICSQDHFSKGLIHSDLNACNILVGDTVPSEGKSIDDIYNFLSQHNGTPAPASFSCHEESRKFSSSSHSNGVLGESIEVDKCHPNHVYGILDFGDTTLSLYLFEVSIAISYVMLNQHDIPPMKAAHHVLRGFLQHIRLSQLELDHLKLCICARFVQSLVLGYVSSSMDSDNEYILIHARRIWPVLKQLWETPDPYFLTQVTKDP